MDRLKGALEIFYSLIPFLSLRSRCLHHDLIKPRVEAVLAGAGGEDVGQLLHEELVDDDAEGVDVGAGVGFLASEDFGGDVAVGAGGVAGLREGVAGAEAAGDAEVEHDGAAFRGDDDVLRLEVAVEDALLMRVLRGGAKVVGDVEEELAVGGGAGLGELGEAAACDPVHDEEGQAFGSVAGKVEFDDVRVIELAEEGLLTLEAGGEGGVVHEVPVEDFDGDLVLAFAGGECRAIDASHAADEGCIGVDAELRVFGGELLGEFGRGEGCGAATRGEEVVLVVGVLGK